MLVAATLFTIGCRDPRDTENTLESVSDVSSRVGAADTWPMRLQASAETWVTVSWQGVLWIVVGACCLYALAVILTRLAGARSLATVSAVDFVMTVAVGTIVGSTLLAKNPPLASGLVALLVLYALKKALSAARARWQPLQSLVDNRPILLAWKGKILTENLARANLTEADIAAKMRQAGVKRLADVHAIFMETAGDFSILSGDGAIDDFLLEGVRGASRDED